MYRLFITILLIITSSSILFAQNGFYVSGGVNFSFVNIENLDFVVSRYNNTRVNCSVFCLSDTMTDFKTMGGAAIQMGWIYKKGATIEFSFTGRSRTQNAIGSAPTGGEVQRDLKVKNFMFGFTFGKHFLMEKVFRIGLLASIDLGNVQVSSRAGTIGEIAELEMTQITKELMLGNTFSINLLIKPKKPPFGIFVRPYYSVQYLQVDFANVNNEINAFTAGADPSELKEINHHPGIIAGILLGLHSPKN